MTREEFSIIVKGLKAVYSEPTFIPDKDAFDVWYALLQDLDYKTVSLATQKHLMTSKFPPRVADIRQQCGTLANNTQQLNEAEAWSLVRKALSNSIYNSVTEFEKLPPLVQKAVGHPENLRVLAMSDDFEEEVEKSHFMRVYRTEVEREKEMLGMSPEIRKLLQNESFYKPQPMIEEQQPDNDGCIPMPQAVRERLDRMFG